ncbi:MAG: hypothetical protein ACREBI_07995 [Nitrosotalea sp.]
MAEIFEQISPTPETVIMNKEQRALSKSFLIMNLNCLVAKNTAHSTAMTIAERFIPSGAFAIPNTDKETIVTNLGIKWK